MALLSRGATGGPAAMQLRVVLSAEVPDVEFDEATVQHLYEVQQNCENNDEVVGEWSPFFIENGAASDDASARGLCLRILQRLQGDNSTTAVPDVSSEPLTVAGLTEWLGRLKIKNYEAKASEWCRQNNVRDVSGIISKVDDFATTVGLKRLEIERVNKDIKKPPSDVAASLRGRPTFGNPPYSILEKLAGGATAEVHRCARLEDGVLKNYAVKVVDLKPYRMLHNFDEIVGKLKREISILFALNHAHVVKLFEVVDESASINKLYLVMELVEGGDLFNYICKNGCQTEDNAARIFVQLVHALKYVHARGIVHRDLKPENVLVVVGRSKDGGVTVKITDFGHSKLLDDGHSIPLTKVGTPQYWPPEILDDKVRQRGYNEKVDLWSLGVLLFVMLTGQYPFESTDKLMSEKIQRGLFYFKEGRSPSPEAQDLIKKLIQPNPDVRLTLDQCLNHSWVRNRLGNHADCSSPDLVKGVGIEEHEETISLPQDPKDVNAFRQALTAFTTRNRFAARLAGKQQLVVSWQTAGLSGQALQTSIVKARGELAHLLQDHFPGFSLLSREGIADPGVGVLSSGYPTLQQNFTTNRSSTPLAPVAEELSAEVVSQMTIQLRVLPGHGAGLHLVEQQGGMRVHEVEQVPGQDLLPDDIIVVINGIPLEDKTVAEVEAVFKENFRDGAILKVSRKSRK